LNFESAHNDGISCIGFLHGKRTRLSAPNDKKDLGGKALSAIVFAAVTGISGAPNAIPGRYCLQKPVLNTGRFAKTRHATSRFCPAARQKKECYPCYGMLMGL